jgi:hypothetical protein
MVSDYPTCCEADFARPTSATTTTIQQYDIQYSTFRDKLPPAITCIMQMRRKYLYIFQALPQYIIISLWKERRRSGNRTCYGVRRFETNNVLYRILPYP